MGDYANGTWYLDMAVEGASWMKEFVPDKKLSWYEQHEEADINEYPLIIQAGHPDKLILKYPIGETKRENELTPIKKTCIPVNDTAKIYLVRFLTNIWIDPLVTHSYDFMEFRELIEGPPLQFRYTVIDSLDGEVILEECKKIIPDQCTYLTGYIGFSHGFENFDGTNSICFFDYSMRFLEWFNNIKSNNIRLDARIICEYCDPYLTGNTFEFGIWYR